ncbi:terpene synthase [Kurthia sp. FSL E2-0154]|uniref:terpene synthase n=1 Tax=Kurthia sp. FSL E2-0154 TaxID=2921358 RepID=UPI0030FB8883
MLEDTRRPLSKEEIKRDPLCYMDEEDINEILNVFKISFISDEKLEEEDSYFLRTFFSELVNNTDITTFIIDEFVKKDLYDAPHLDEVPFFNNLLTYIDSDIVLSEIDDHKWMYLSQD